MDLKNIYLFRELDQNMLNKISQELEIVEVESEEIIIQEGDISSGEAYIIQEGQAVVFRQGEEIVRLEAPDIFGEIALVTDSPRTATVESRTDMILLKITKKLLFKIINEFPNGIHIEEMMKTRIMENAK